MGNGGSKLESGYEEFEKVDALTEKIQQHLKLEDGDNSNAEANPLSSTSLKEWSEQVLEDPKNRLALSAISNGDMKQIIKKRDAIVDDSIHVFSHKIDLEGSPVTNQQSSGRCWIFAATNILRTFVQRKYNIEDFQLSQAYLYFYDKLEKSNWFLQQIIETAAADEDLDSRLVQTLFQDPVSDGGQWDMIVNLVNKYGVVPQSAFPDSWNATHSSGLNYVVVHKLREYGLVLRKAIEDGCSTTQVNALKAKFVKQIHQILTISLGAPPGPNDTIIWEFYDKNKKYHKFETTPLSFAKYHVDYDVSNRFSLIHDPRNDYKKLYTVDRLGNIVGGKDIEYVNATPAVLKRAAIKSIQNNEPVFFGSDVGKFSERTGIMDVNAWDYELAFNTKLGLNKAEQLRVGESAMTHAMVLTAVNIENGKPTKWRVENSWGDAAGNKGYMIMTDDWFDEYVYQVVTHPKYVEKEYTDIWKSKEYNVLPRWDPLGALA